MKGVWEIARIRPSGFNRPSEALEDSTTVTAPMIAIVTPKRSRCEIVRLRSTLSGQQSIPCGSVHQVERVKRNSWPRVQTAGSVQLITSMRHSITLTVPRGATVEAGAHAYEMKLPSSPTFMSKKPNHLSFSVREETATGAIEHYHSLDFRYSLSLPSSTEPSVSVFSVGLRGFGILPRTLSPSTISIGIAEN